MKLPLEVYRETIRHFGQRDELLLHLPEHGTPRELIADFCRRSGCDGIFIHGEMPVDYRHAGAGGFGVPSGVKAIFARDYDALLKPRSEAEYYQFPYRQIGYDMVVNLLNEPAVHPAMVYQAQRKGGNE